MPTQRCVWGQIASIEGLIDPLTNAATAKRPLIPFAGKAVRAGFATSFSPVDGITDGIETLPSSKESSAPSPAGFGRHFVCSRCGNEQGVLEGPMAYSFRAGKRGARTLSITGTETGFFDGS
jgi:hypothetical protein